MIVASMSLEEKLAHVQSELRAVNNKFRDLIGTEEHAFKIDPGKRPRVVHRDYTSPKRIQWTVALRTTKRSSRLFLSAWWQIQHVGIEAFVLHPDGAFYFDTHFFQRYRIRESEVEPSVENLKTFLRTNYDITMKHLTTQRFGLQEAAGVAVEGLFVGTVRPGNIIACDTFLSDGILFQDQKQLQDQLRFHAATKEWSPVQLKQYGKWLNEKIAELEALGL